MLLPAEPNSEKIELVNRQGQSLGQIVIERVDSGLVSGAFAPTELFVRLEELFKDYEKAVNLQAISVVDELDSQIARLGLGVVLTAGPRINIGDVQIWSDGAISFRPIGHAASLLVERGMAGPSKR